MTCISNEGKFSLGEHTLLVPTELYRLNRERLCKNLSEVLVEDAYVLLQGGSNLSHYCTDVDYVFRQEPYFHWAFGVSEPDCFGLIHVSSGKTHLFFPRPEESHIVWLGKPLSLDEYKCRYKVEEALFVDMLGETLDKFQPKLILTLNGKNTDSDKTCNEAYFNGIERFILDNHILHKVIANCRVIKTEHEKAVMRYATKVTCDAHKSVMTKCKPGLYEYQCEANFLHYAYYVGGCRHVGYNDICCSGSNGAVLHYGHATKPNEKKIQDGDMCLFDMGAVYSGYTADVTVSFPANGKFTDDQRAIYNTVLSASHAVMSAIKPGVSWVDMHIMANKVILKGLSEINILQGDVDEMFEAGLAAIFQPHGLGHLLGIDVHDVGGYLEGYPARPEKPGLKSLRTARNLEVGMALTIEPGCYFIESLLNQALNDPKLSIFLNKNILNRFWNFGGVRIEDNIFVTENGIENYTPVPRTVEEIEEWMSKKEVVLNNF
ncbi:Aminopeptidase P, N-terminal,Creatinase/Aminopeptidase P, N-terminal,Peptidase [Cinara cedri]|uniref:Xaa-Pro dipeptidase n=1 Tax=Cinara cedri TaxID=506608 RepID=A0A5E4MGK4_9HEMI|nr:Aminopeptidase P, N-terminal,Creatinase/Aminopeptidase P, N-terminal,Peptidase [Cinara cedri]